MSCLNVRAAVEFLWEEAYCTRDIDGKHTNITLPPCAWSMFSQLQVKKWPFFCCDITYAHSNNNKRILRKRKSLDYSHVFPDSSNKGTVLSCDITYAPSNTNKNILRQRKSLHYSHVFPVTSNKGTVLSCDITYAPSNTNRILRQIRSLDYSNVFPVKGTKGPVFDVASHMPLATPIEYCDKGDPWIIVMFSQLQVTKGSFFDVTSHMLPVTTSEY